MNKLLMIAMSVTILFFAFAAHAQDDAVEGPAEEAAPAEAAPAAVPADDVTASAVYSSDSGDVERTAMNSIYIEGLGSGLLYSINYERMIIDQLGVRLGFAYMAFGASVTSEGTTVSAKAKFVFVPITASWVGLCSTSKKHCLELGGGATLIFASAAGSGPGVTTEGSGVAGFGEILGGYRLQPADGGFQFRIGVMGIFGPGLSFSAEDPTAWGMIPWGYLSLGGTFGR